MPFACRPPCVWRSDEAVVTHARDSETRGRELALLAYFRAMLITRFFEQIHGPASFDPARDGLFTDDVSDKVGGFANHSFYTRLLPEAFAKGVAPKEWVDAVFARLDAKVDAENAKRTARHHGRTGPVVLLPYPQTFAAEMQPFTLCAAGSYSGRARWIEPVFAMVDVARNPCGNISLSFDGDAFLPPPLWFRRKFFTPRTDALPLHFGAFSDYVETVRAWSWEGVNPWQDALSFFDACWEAASGLSWGDWCAGNDFEVHPGWIREGRSDQAGLAILAMYRQIREQLHHTPQSVALFTELCTGTHGDEVAIPRCHLGQMGDTYGLMPSQRVAVQSAAAMHDQRILAINGPPGSGKTVLLQSVVADLVVRGALARKSPLILACGATNQAVTNILEAFAASAKPGDDLLAQRWIPGLASFGMYAKAQSRPDEPWSTQMLTLNPGMDLQELSPGPTDKFYSDARKALDDSLEGAAVSVRHLLVVASRPESLKAWERNISQWCGRDVARKEGMDLLRDRLALVVEAIKTCDAMVAAWSIAHRESADRKESRRRFLAQIKPVVLLALGQTGMTDSDASRSWLDACKRQARVIANPRHEGDSPADVMSAALDVTLRRRAFLLAARWFEGEFLRQVRAIPWSTPRARNDAFRMLACVSPCMVATFDKIGSVFDIWDGSARRCLWGKADLLIVDEAGQAGPDRGAAAFGLAKRALVVGDVLQLSPVESDDQPFFSAEIAEQYEVFDADAQERGALCGLAPDPSTEICGGRAGSVMRMASYVSEFSSPGEERPGLWLYDHFRCDPAIIAYSNQHWYGQKLVVRTRPYGGDRRAMDHLAVHGRCEAVGGSKRNPEEARVISRWLAEHRAVLEAEYNMPLDQIVAIITPFHPHAGLLRDTLRKHPGLRDCGRKMTVGTVHALQGAERPLILFSTVYAEPPPDSVYFMDRADTMLNVAVSRAKHAFIAVGDPQVFFHARHGTATWELGQHLGLAQSA